MCVRVCLGCTSTQTLNFFTRIINHPNTFNHFTQILFQTISLYNQYIVLNLNTFKYFFLFQIKANTANTWKTNTTKILNKKLFSHRNNVGLIRTPLQHLIHINKNVCYSRIEIELYIHNNKIN